MADSINRHYSLKGTLTKEIRIVNSIRTYLDSVKAWSVKLHGGPMQETGLPDIISCYRGFFLGIEVKAPGRKKNLTPRQALHQDLMNRAGGIALVVESVEEVQDIIRKIDELRQLQSPPLLS